MAVLWTLCRCGWGTGRTRASASSVCFADWQCSHEGASTGEAGLTHPVLHSMRQSAEALATPCFQRVDFQASDCIVLGHRGVRRPLKSGQADSTRIILHVMSIQLSTVQGPPLRSGLDSSMCKARDGMHHPDFVSSASIRPCIVSRGSMLHRRRLLSRYIPTLAYEAPSVMHAAH